jgi:DNA-binding CsgD family transcriptional regulator
MAPRPSSIRAAARHVALYGGACAVVTLAAAWIEYGLAPSPGRWGLALVAVAALFAALGAWIGHRLTPRARSGTFVRNTAAAHSLGLSARELEVLDRLAEGAPNKLIARRLGISPNTVKTHVARVLDKLDARTRTEAIARARALDLLP